MVNNSSYAQTILGLMYYEEKVVRQDYVLAHMWLNHASDRGFKSAIESKNIVEKKMTLQQIEKAQKEFNNITKEIEI